MTAVEWLEKVYSDACYNNMTHNIQISKDFIPNIIAKAKEMEKQQIIDAVNFGDERGKITTYSTAEQYYNETFKKK
jgi:Ni,Fe-hydrogenase maturation factor